MREERESEREMKEIEVVYEKGVFKPLEDVELKEGVKGESENRRRGGF